MALESVIRSGLERIKQISEDGEEAERELERLRTEADHFLVRFAARIGQEKKKEYLTGLAHGALSRPYQKDIDNLISASKHPLIQKEALAEINLLMEVTKAEEDLSEMYWRLSETVEKEVIEGNQALLNDERLMSHLYENCDSKEIRTIAGRELGYGFFKRMFYELRRALRS